MDNKVQSLLGVSMDKIREMVDVDTVVGTPIQTEGGITLIPVSKVTYGFAGGGSDLPSKTTSGLFGGGAGAGITVTPIAFISIVDGKVSMLPMLSKPDTVDTLVGKIPEVVDTIADWLSRRKKEKENATSGGEFQD